MKKILAVSALLALSFSLQVNAVENHVYKKAGEITLQINARFPEGHQKTYSRPAIVEMMADAELI
jgi:hypothetical protein